jgi:hypothetical protein
MKIAITIDTEADNQWVPADVLSTRNIGFCRPFQFLCERHGIRPTYLISSEIALDPQAVAFLRPLVEHGRAEVGAHLHPWTTPPFRDIPGLRFNDEFRVFPSELCPQLLEEKLVTLTSQITEAVGYQPRSFRAGRFGFNSACAHILRKLGYIVDSSVTPFVSWKHHTGLPGGEGGPDFRDFGVNPFLIRGEGDSGDPLIEIPVTIISTNLFLRRFPWLIPYYQILAYRCGFKPQPVWLRPFPEASVSELLAVLDAAEQQQVQIAVMMFHSSELMSGCSPYRPTEESVRHLFLVFKEFFEAIQQRGNKSVTLSEAADWIIHTQHFNNGSIATRYV